MCLRFATLNPSGHPSTLVVSIALLLVLLGGCGFDPGLHRRCAWTPHPGEAKFYADTTDCPSPDFFKTSHWVLCAGGPSGCSGPSCQGREIGPLGSGKVLQIGYLGSPQDGYTVEMRIRSAAGCGARAHEYFGMFYNQPFPAVASLRSYHEFAMISHSGEKQVSLSLGMTWASQAHTLGLVFRPHEFWDAVSDEFPNDSIIFHINANGVDYVTIDAYLWGMDQLCPGGACGAFHAYSVDWVALLRHVQQKGIWLNAPPLDQLVPWGLSVDLETFDGGSIDIQHRKFVVY